MPFHRGHQLLVDAAFAECDDVTVLVYDSLPAEAARLRMPVEKRLGWIRELYPSAEQILAIDDPWYDLPGHDDSRFANRYAEQVAFLGRFDRVFTSEPGYEKFAHAVGGEHVLLDVARETVPISGTEIRADLFAHRGWMDSRVYASLIQKVALVGTESAGKSTLARSLAEVYETRWVHEFGRELWESQNLQGSFSDHLKMGTRQHRREEAALPHSRGFLFCDTTAWTTLHWSLMSYGTVDARLAALVDRTMDDYVWVLCSNDFGWVQDGTRELAGGRAAAFQIQQEFDLRRRGVDYVTVRGPVEERIAQVEAALAARTAGGGITPRRPSILLD